MSGWILALSEMVILAVAPATCVSIIERSATSITSAVEDSGPTNPRG